MDAESNASLIVELVELEGVRRAWLHRACTHLLKRARAGQHRRGPQRQFLPSRRGAAGGGRAGAPRDFAVPPHVTPSSLSLACGRVRLSDSCHRKLRARGCRLRRSEANLSACRRMRAKYQSARAATYVLYKGVGHKGYPYIPASSLKHPEHPGHPGHPLHPGHPAHPALSRRHRRRSPHRLLHAIQPGAATQAAFEYLVGAV